MCPKEYSPTTFTCSQRYSDNSVVVVPAQIRCSMHLPTDATRETLLDDNLNIRKVSIVLKSDLVQNVIKAHKKMSKGGEDERLGILCGVVKPLLHELGHSNLPRNRFLKKSIRYGVIAWQ